MEKVGIAVNEKSYTLLDVLRSIQSVLQRTYANRSYWVRCELARLSLHAQSGHCYLELVEKDEHAILAQLKGIIWADKYEIITEKFKAVTNTPLAGGMKVLFLCTVNFHPVHGLSLQITDIEPSFTLGEMARMKNESIARLKSEGIYDMNRRLRMPLLPKRIAVISVETSRGYHDFMSTIINHPVSYSIHHKLFEAILQGENAVPSLIRAMNNILAEKESFDAIAIIRGGAGDAGLACYDEFALASVIARSELPVISGIGHATNETVVEMIVYKNCITPTAAATFILDKFDIQNQSIAELTLSIKKTTLSFLNEEKQELYRSSSLFCLIVKNRMESLGYMLKSIHASMPSNVSSFFSITRKNIGQAINTLLQVKRLSNQKENLKDLDRTTTLLLATTSNQFAYAREDLKELSYKVGEASAVLSARAEQVKHLEEKVNLLDPINTLKRGYSITRYKGKAITEAHSIKNGDQIQTELADGILISTIEKNK